MVVFIVSITTLLTPAISPDTIPAVVSVVFLNDSAGKVTPYYFSPIMATMNSPL